MTTLSVNMGNLGNIQAPGHLSRNRGESVAVRQCGRSRRRSSIRRSCQRVNQTECRSARRCRGGRRRRRGRGESRLRPDGLGLAFGVAGDQRAVRTGAGLVARKTRIHSSICRLNSSGSMNPSIRSAPKKWPMPLPTLRVGISWRSAKRRHERPPVRPAQDAAEDVDHRREAVALVSAMRAVAAQRQERPAVDHPRGIVR